MTAAGANADFDRDWGPFLVEDLVSTTCSVSFPAPALSEKSDTVPPVDDRESSGDFGPDDEAGAKKPLQWWRPRTDLKKSSSSRTFSMGSFQRKRGVLRVSSFGDLFGGMILWMRARMSESGMRRTRMATRRERAPRMSEISHWVALRGEVDRASPPKFTMRSWPVTIIMFMPIKK